MASGDVVVFPLQEQPPESDYATRDVRLGSASPKEGFSVWDFDASSAEYMDHLCQLVGYDDGGLTFNGEVAFSSATSGSAVVGMAVRRLDAADDMDVGHTYDFNVTKIAAPATCGYPVSFSISFTHGADMDSWANGEQANVRFYRNAGTATDDAAGDLELRGWPMGQET